MDGGDRLRSHVASLRCTGCGRSYADGHVRVRAERDSVAFVDLICRSCGGQASAIATICGPGRQAGRIDLGELDEAVAPAMAIEDVLEMGRFLATFDGDFRAILGSDGPRHGPARA